MRKAGRAPDEAWTPAGLTAALADPLLQVGGEQPRRASRPARAIKQRTEPLRESCSLHETRSGSWRLLAQVVGLIRTNFLKRFESSVWAFEQSCDRLLQKLLAFVQVHSETDSEKKRLELWKLQNADILGYAAQLTLKLGDTPDEDVDEDMVPEELLEKVVPLPQDEYKVDEILDETFLDLDQIVRFLAETRKFEPRHDDKLQKLIRLLKSKELAQRKVLIFSEFSDTARSQNTSPKQGSPGSSRSTAAGRWIART